MKLTERQLAAMYEYGIPEYMHDGIQMYYEHGIPPGGFLCAVIDNDLKAACGKADSTNIRCLQAYATWFYNQAPSGTWGFPGAVDKWIERFHSESDRDTA